MTAEDVIGKAVEVMKKGGIILYPSDTIWGIGCDALNRKAITKVYNLKQRIDKKNLIILVNSLEEVAAYVRKVPEVVHDLIQSVNRPLTIIYPDAVNLPDSLVAEDGSIGIRVVKNQLCEAMIRQLGRPIVSTSANISGGPTPLTSAMISNHIRNGVDYIVNTRQEQVTEMKASTIIKVDSNNDFQIIRE
ncbi:MAG: L-threonylcarbamoyladenylate synthase [Bacteroidales bacterium]